ncbi:MAG: hypothetical protein JRI68_06345 [Deltaproteobacteria bacterium]|nr:hypothetical protein [Deltaproteobacteria bacterium]
MEISARVLAGLLGILALAFAAPQACGAGGGSETTGGSSGTTSSSSGDGAGGNGGGIGIGGVGGLGSSSGGGEGGACASTTSEAEEGFAPADIIIAVDTSGSMDLEAQWTQQNMNVLVTTITGSGIDAHVVMISDNDICVPTPLGSGNCPSDENLPSYRHVQTGVGSDDALEKIISTYPQWKDSLRLAATKTFVVVSDDDSDLSASGFTNQLLALDPPTFQGFKFDAIVSFAPPWASGPCWLLSAAQGTVYQALVQQTGGVAGDLCLQNFAPVFQDIATAVVQNSQIDCVYDIPDPGNGETIDFDKVNVEFQPDPNAPGQVIPYVPGGAAACDPNGGWYYDDPNNPTQIIFCEATCTAVQSQTEGQVSVVFGCETVIR